MARRKRKQLITGLLLLLCSALFPTLSHADDGGLIASIEASHKFSKKLSAGLETEFRSRNNFRTADRVSIGGDVSYKVLSWLKASAGYTLLIDNLGPAPPLQCIAHGELQDTARGAEPA